MCNNSDDSASREMINMQKEEAAAARKKEEERQARIKKGLTRINQMFEGTPVMGKRTKAFTYKAPAAGTTITAGGQVAGLPAGYTYVVDPANPGKAAVAPTPAVRPDPNTAAGGRVGVGQGHVNYKKTAMQQMMADQQAAAAAGSAAVPAQYLIKGPDGKTYKVGSKFNYDETYDTGKKKGGIGDDFYNKFKQGMLDYYMPQVAEKYGDAKDQLTYRLADAGLLRSSMAGEQVADLTKQNELQQAAVRNKADAAAADLKTRVASEKQKAVSQLYATEDPNVAANQATAAIKNITADKGDQTPLGDIFTLATIGGAGYLKGAQNAALRNKFSPGTASGGRVIG